MADRRGVRHDLQLDRRAPHRAIDLGLTKCGTVADPLSQINAVSVYPKFTISERWRAVLLGRVPVSRFFIARRFRVSPMPGNAP
jgi:hypothetical protein